MVVLDVTLACAGHIGHQLENLDGDYLQSWPSTCGVRRGEKHVFRTVAVRICHGQRLATLINVTKNRRALFRSVERD